MRSITLNPQAKKGINPTGAHLGLTDASTPRPRCFTKALKQVISNNSVVYRGVTIDRTGGKYVINQYIKLHSLDEAKKLVDDGYEHIERSMARPCETVNIL